MAFRMFPTLAFIINTIIGIQQDSFIALNFFVISIFIDIKIF